MHAFGFAMLGGNLMYLPPLPANWSTCPNARCNSIMPMNTQLESAILSFSKICCHNSPLSASVISSSCATPFPTVRYPHVIGKSTSTISTRISFGILLSVFIRHWFLPSSHDCVHKPALVNDSESTLLVHPRQV